MKFAKPIAFLLLCNGIAAFVPRHQRRQLAPALAARGNSKAKKEAAAARILESPPVAEVATETNVLPLVADVVLEIAQSPLEPGESHRLSHILGGRVAKARMILIWWHDS